MLALGHNLRLLDEAGSRGAHSNRNQKTMTVLTQGPSAKPGTSRQISSRTSGVENFGQALEFLKTGMSVVSMTHRNVTDLRGEKIRRSENFWLSSCSLNQGSGTPQLRSGGNTHHLGFRSSLALKTSPEKPSNIRKLHDMTSIALKKHFGHDVMGCWAAKFSARNMRASFIIR